VNIRAPVRCPVGAGLKLMPTAQVAPGASIVGEIGLDPVDVGGLAESRDPQPGTRDYRPDFVLAEVQRALSPASRERPVESDSERMNYTSNAVEYADATCRIGFRQAES